MKFEDLDGDGTRDDGEPGLDGWVIYADLDDDGIRDGGEPFATTAGGGLYTIAGILPGTRKIREEQQMPWTQTAPAGGYYETHFLPGFMLTDLDFGNHLDLDFGDAPYIYPTLRVDNERTARYRHPSEAGKCHRRGTQRPARGLGPRRRLGQHTMTKTAWSFVRYLCGHMAGWQ